MGSIPHFVCAAQPDFLPVRMLKDEAITDSTRQAVVEARELCVCSEPPHCSGTAQSASIEMRTGLLLLTSGSWLTAGGYAEG